MPNNPNHLRHFATDWRQCIHKGCITHEAAKQAEKDKGIPPVYNHTHLDHRILNWTECANNNCEIHRAEKEEGNRKITQQNEEGKGWALNEEETQRIHAYVDDQIKIGNIRPRTPVPTITKLDISALEEGEIVKEPEQMDKSTNTQTQHLSTPEESEEDSTDDELDNESDANHI